MNAASQDMSTAYPTALFPLYRLAVLPFFALPDSRYLTSSFANDFAAPLAELPLDDLPDEVRTGFVLMDAASTEICNCMGDEAAIKGLADALCKDRAYLFGGLSPALGAPPPHESHFGSLPTAEVLAEVSKAYGEAGIKLAMKELPDYLGVELEFMRMLLVQESLDEETASQALAFERAFFEEHIHPWAGQWVGAALPCARTDFYKGHLQLLKGLLALEQSRLVA